MENQMEKSMLFMENSVGHYLDMCLLALDSYTERKDRIDESFKNYMSRLTSEQEKSTRIYNDLLNQTRKNQQQYQNFMKEAITSMMENAHKFMPSYSK